MRSRLTCNPPRRRLDRSLTLRNGIALNHCREHVLEYVGTPVADVQGLLTSALRRQDTLYFNGCDQPSETARRQILRQLFGGDYAFSQPASPRWTEVAKAVNIKMEE